MIIKPQYIVDEENQKLAVQLDIKTYQKIEEVLENNALFHLMEEECKDEEESETLTLEEAKSFYHRLEKES